MDNLNFKLPNKKEQTWFAHKDMEKYQVMIKQEKKVKQEKISVKILISPSHFLWSSKCEIEFCLLVEL